jgi:hypothetical protein
MRRTKLSKRIVELFPARARERTAPSIERLAVRHAEHSYRASSRDPGVDEASGASHLIVGMRRHDEQVAVLRGPGRTLGESAVPPELV